LGGCNLLNKNTEEKNNSNQQANLSNTAQQNQTNQQGQQNQETAKHGKTESITIYIDKNCQLSVIPQCDENTIKQQITPVL